MDVTLSPRGRTTIAWIGVILALLVLFQAYHALAPFVWAVIAAYILHPLVASIQRKTRLPRQVITIWLYLVIGLVLAFLFINVTPPLIEQINQLQQETIPRMIGDIQGWIDQAQKNDDRFSGLDPNFVQARLSLLGQQLADLLSTEAVPLLISTFSFAIETFVFLIAAFYLIVYGDKFVMAIRNFMNRRYHREFDQILVDINSTLGAYLRGQLVLFVIMSVCSYIALRILDVDYALSLAIATGFLELIPVIGPWTAGTIAVLIALFQPTAPFGWSNTTLAIVVALVYFTLRQLEDAFVIPLVIGRIVHLHPLLVIFVLVIGTSLGGALGLILAVPMAAVLKIIMSYFYGKVMAKPQRIVETIPELQSLRAARDRLPSYTNATVVLLIEPGALHWEDLPLMQEVAAEALEHSVDLEVVTPDGVAATLASAAGLRTVAVPFSTEDATAVSTALSGRGEAPAVTV